MGRVQDKVVLITGGARGLGASHVRRFVKEGAKVIFTDILVKEGQSLAKELGDNVAFIKHDVVNEAEWNHVVSEAEDKFGPINILVNNAGIAPNKPLEDTTEEEYRKVIEVNQLSAFLGMKTVLPSMRKTENGSMINVSSLAGLIASRNQIAYVASKFAVRGMTKAAAIEFGEYGIRVNSIHPGIIESPMTTSSEMQAMLAEISKTIPLGRVAKPEEVSNLILFLASDESSYSTGSEFVIDGGLFAQ